MATAIVVNADIGAGPAIRARLLGDGFVVHAIDNAAADRSSVGGAVARIGADYGVDLLVNNAPRFEVRNALDMSAASFSSLLGSGLHGVFSSCREAARCAAESGTELVIVNVISTLAVVGLAGRMG
ncbi:MAG: SDR family NAD(P)-dependent oxidoreductase, partial [Actinobacteria bacterium]